MKSKLVAALLALLFGGFGLHKFYLGQNVRGVLYLLFFWSYIPSFIAFFEAIGLLIMSEENFNKKFNSSLNIQQLYPKDDHITVRERDYASKIKELQELKEQGLITKEEFNQEKAKLNEN